MMANWAKAARADCLAGDGARVVVGASVVLGAGGVVEVVLVLVEVVLVVVDVVLVVVDVVVGALVDVVVLPFELVVVAADVVVVTVATWLVPGAPSPAVAPMATRTMKARTTQDMICAQRGHRRKRRHGFRGLPGPSPWDASLIYHLRRERG